MTSSPVGENMTLSPSQLTGPAFGQAPGEIHQSCYTSERVNAMSELSLDFSKIDDLCRQYGVRQLGVFGSVARGEADEASDMDLLVEFSEPVSLLEMVALERKLSNALGRKVDLLTEGAISPYLRNAIKRDLWIVYEAQWR